VISRLLFQFQSTKRNILSTSGQYLFRQNKRKTNFIQNA